MPEAPYARIVSELRRRIGAGELAPGDRMPSTRQIVREWGVAMATATKVLTTLRHEGLVHTVPNVGSVVAPSAGAGAPPRPTLEPSSVSREQVVQSAIDIADAEGLAALSMRRVAAEFGIAAMSLYRYVASKDELVLAMVDAAYGEERLPGVPAEHWRERLETAARLQWRLYRKHPWLAGAMAISRPHATPNGMAWTECVLTALATTGTPPDTALDLSIILFSQVRGLALAIEAEAQARAETGITDEQWLDEQHPAFAKLTARFPHLAEVVQNRYNPDLDRMFELGLRRLVDGIGSLTQGAADRSNDA